MSIICHYNNNEFLNNHFLINDFPATIINHQGNVYREQSYVQVSFLMQTIKVIGAIALTIMTCFTALAFQSFRQFWIDAIKGRKKVILLKPQSFFINPIIKAITASILDRNNTKMNSEFSFWPRRQPLTWNPPLPLKLPNLSSFGVGYNYPKLEHFLAKIPNFEPISINMNNRLLPAPDRILEAPPRQISDFSNSSAIENVHDFCGYWDITDISFLQDYPNLTRVDLHGCNYIEDFSILENCANLTHLKLNACQKIKDFSFLQRCNKLTDINLAYTKINDISILENCLSLKQVTLYGCQQIKDDQIQYLRSKGVNVSI